ncbi:hypothetical protein D9M68_944070 [compost metagenome]
MRQPCSSSSVPASRKGRVASSIQKVMAPIGTSVWVRFISWVPKPQPAAASSISSVPAGLPVSALISPDSSSTVPASAQPMPTQAKPPMRSRKKTRPHTTAQIGMV